MTSPLLALVAAVPLLAQEPDHWAYRPVVRPAVPAADGWGRSPLDHFVLQRMREHGLQPSPPADRATWLRRATLDLTGLPPTLADQAATKAIELELTTLR